VLKIDLYFVDFRQNTLSLKKENFKIKMNQNKVDIFGRMLEGGLIPFSDPEYPKIFEAVSQTIKLSVALNTSTDITQIRKRLSKIIGQQINESTIIFTPFYTNFGKHIQIGKNVFINHDCTFLDLGGIIIEDEVLIGPKVSIITENHPVNPNERKMLDLKSVTIKRNVWIGANATILPGVTVGENSVIAAGSVVTKDVLANTVVAGVPAIVIKQIG
jgi:acetyltransferase-like isoleucine patch superfamily enzyme